MATRKPKPKKLVIHGKEIQPGERTTVLLPMPKLYDWTPLNMPVHVIRGKEPGPVLCVLSAIHGDEVNGVEIVRRLLRRSALKKIKGTLLAVPIVNIFGFLYQDRYLMDRRDLNRSFPGSPNGSLAARLAYLVKTELIDNATHIIDLHAGSLHRTNLPQIRADLDLPGIRALAGAFHVPVILHAALRDGSVRQYACDKKIPLLLYEAGEALRFDELSIRTGINGVLGVMQKLKMLELKKQPLKKLKPVLARSSYWVRAPSSGVLRPFVALGKNVKKGDLLAIIANPTSTEEYKLYSPISGVVIARSNLPLTYAGAALFHIATFKDLKDVIKQIEFLQEAHDVAMTTHPGGYEPSS